MTDSAGNVVERYAYTAYGVPTILAPDGTTERTESAVSNPVLFTGRRWDGQSGLYYYRARYYDPALGRFLSRDPITYYGGIHLYTYLADAPLNSTDPTGLSDDLDLPEGADVEVIEGKAPYSLTIWPGNPLAKRPPLPPPIVTPLRCRPGWTKSCREYLYHTQCIKLASQTTTVFVTESWLGFFKQNVLYYGEWTLCYERKHFRKKCRCCRWCPHGPSASMNFLCTPYVVEKEWWSYTRPLQRFRGVRVAGDPSLDWGTILREVGKHSVDAILKKVTH